MRDASDARLDGQPPRAAHRPAEDRGPPGVVGPAAEPRRQPQVREAPVHQHAGDAHRRLLEAWGETADAADTSCISVTLPSDGQRPDSTPPWPRRRGTSCSRQATTGSSATMRPGGVRGSRRCTRRRSSTASRAAAGARAAGNGSAGCVEIRAAARQRVGREVATPSMTAEGGTSSGTVRGWCASIRLMVRRTQESWPQKPGCGAGGAPRSKRVACPATCYLVGGGAVITRLRQEAHDRGRRCAHRRGRGRGPHRGEDHRRAQRTRRALAPRQGGAVRAARRRRTREDCPTTAPDSLPPCLG